MLMTSVAIGEAKWERRNRVELHNHRLRFDEWWKWYRVTYRGLLTFEVTGDRSAKRGRYRQAQLAGRPVDRGVRAQGPRSSSGHRSTRERGSCIATYRTAQKWPRRTVRGRRRATKSTTT